MGARESWAQEMESAFLYRVIAEREPTADGRALFANLAREAETQARVWATDIVGAEGAPPGDFVPGARARIVAALVRRFGARRIKGVLAAMKVRGMSVFGSAPGAGHAMPHSVEEIGRRHHGRLAGGNLRAAVFGASDGLVS